MNAKSFLELLTLHGHDGDAMCIGNIQSEMKKGVASLAKAYNNYIEAEQVKKLSPAEVKALLKEGKKVWCKEGFFSYSSKLGMPILGGEIVMPADLSALCKEEMITLK